MGSDSYPSDQVFKSGRRVLIQTTTAACLCFLRLGLSLKPQLICLAWLADVQASLVSVTAPLCPQWGLQTHSAAPTMAHGSWDSESVLCACTVSMLLSEAFLQTS